MALPAIAVVGLALQAYGTIKAGSDAAAAGERDAQIKEMQARETEIGGEREVRLLRIRGVKTIGEQANAYAQSGVELSGSPLLMLEETNAQMLEEESALKHDTAYRAEMLRRGGDISRELGAQRQTAAWISAGSSTLTGAASLAMSTRRASAPRSLTGGA